MDFSKEVGIANLGIIRGLSNQMITSSAIQGAKGYAPSLRQMRMAESLVDLNNQMTIKTGGGDSVDPLANLKNSLGLKPMDSKPVAKTGSDHRITYLTNNFDALSKKLDKLIDVLNPSK